MLLRSPFMKKAPKTNLDPLQIFLHVSHFHESDHRLRNTVPLNKPDQLTLIAHPAMVLSVFSTELYLKCLLCIESGSVPPTHNLKTLYRDLVPNTKRRLEVLWDADIRQPHRQKTLD